MTLSIDFKDVPSGGALNLGCFMQFATSNETLGHSGHPWEYATASEFTGTDTFKSCRDHKPITHSEFVKLLNDCV